MAVPKSRLRATKKYQDKAYDRAAVYLKKGAKDRIRKVSDLSVNAYISMAVERQLALDEKKSDLPGTEKINGMPDGITEEKPFR